MKIALEEADHPMAKMVLRIIRESASIDDAVEAAKSRKVKKKQRRQAQMAIKTNTPLKSPRTAAALKMVTSQNSHAHGKKMRNPLSDLGMVDEEADLETGEDTE
jgi:hypothetical protein